MQKIVDAISIAINSKLNHMFLSELRMYLWDGFAVHNVKDRYIYYLGDPGIDEDGWYIVRDSLMPIVKELDCRFGEFGTINWENV